jgi:hypothetical protein
MWEVNTVKCEHALEEQSQEIDTFRNPIKLNQYYCMYSDGFQNFKWLKSL